MNEQIQINLKATCILDVPMNAYDEFTFIVNGKSYKTTKIVADLLSSKICNIHTTDPTFDEFSVTTKNKGDFSKIIDLINFDKHVILKSEFQFFSEIFEKIGCKYINFTDKELENIRDETVFQRFKLHLQNQDIYSKYLEKESDYLAVNLYDILKTHEDELLNMSNDAIQKIIKNPKLQLESEDQLLTFLNKLYLNDPNNSNLYQYVQFCSISKEKIDEFIKTFNTEDLTCETWRSLCARLSYNVSINHDKSNRYFEKKKLIYNNSRKFDGILNYMRSKLPNNIFKEINITSSSIYMGNEGYSPQNVLFYENPNVEFATESIRNSWICFDFKERKVIPDYYSIRSSTFKTNNYHPKSWVIEGSNDNESWDLLDEQKNNSDLNGPSYIHSFPINNSNSNKYQFIRMKLLESWTADEYFLHINNFELFGSLI